MSRKKKPKSSGKKIYLETKHIFWFFENYPYDAAESVYAEVTRIMNAKRDGTLKRPALSWEGIFNSHPHQNQTKHKKKPQSRTEQNQ